MKGIDYAVIGFYFLVLIYIRVFLLRRKDRTSEEYFLAGRNLAWPLIMTSLFATDMSSTAFIGSAGNGYATGIVYANFQWIAVGCILVLVTWLLPYYLKNRIVTMPEFLQKRFGTPSQSIYSILSLILYAVVEIPLLLYTASLVFHAVAGWNLWETALVIGTITGLYTAIGGLRAVVYADVMQTVFILAGGVYVAFVALQKVGGWGALHGQLPPSYFHAIQPVVDPSDPKRVVELPWGAVAISLPVLGIWYWTTNQYIMQRVLAARNINEGRLGLLGAGMLKFTLPFILLLPGMCGKILMPDIAVRDNVLPQLILALIPVGFKGLVLAALIAALMSHMESALNSASTLYVNDLHRRLINPQLNDQRAIYYGKTVSLGIMVVGMCVAPMLGNIKSIYDYLQAGYAYIAVPAVVLFLGGVLWKRAGAAAAIAAYVGGLGTMVVIEVLNRTQRANVLQYYQVGYAFVGAVIAFFLVSLVSPKPTEAQADTVREYPLEARELGSGWRFWPAWAAAVGAMLVLTYWWFW